MGCCDGTTDDELVPGADWVWAYSTSNDVSGWENPLVELWMGDTLLASSQGDEPKVSLEEFGDHPATDFDEGVFTYSVAAEHTINATASTVRLLAWARVDGIDGQRDDRTYRLRKTPVVRDEEGS